MTTVADLNRRDRLWCQCHRSAHIAIDLIDRSATKLRGILKRIAVRKRSLVLAGARLFVERADRLFLKHFSITMHDFFIEREVAGTPVALVYTAAAGALFGALEALISHT